MVYWIRRIGAPPQLGHPARSRPRTSAPRQPGTCLWGDLPES